MTMKLAKVENSKRKKMANTTTGKGSDINLNGPRS